MHLNYFQDKHFCCWDILEDQSYKEDWEVLEERSLLRFSSVGFVIVADDQVLHMQEISMYCTAMRRNMDLHLCAGENISTWGLEKFAKPFLAVMPPLLRYWGWENCLLNRYFQQTDVYEVSRAGPRGSNFNKFPE